MNELKHGQGVYYYANGDRYEGSFIDGQMTGKGLFVTRNGVSYVGDFVDGQMTGYGLFTSLNGKRYEGHFINGKRVSSFSEDAPHQQDPQFSHSQQWSKK